MELHNEVRTKARMRAQRRHDYATASVEVPTMPVQRVRGRVTAP